MMTTAVYKPWALTPTCQEMDTAHQERMARRMRSYTNSVLHHQVILELTGLPTSLPRSRQACPTGSSSGLPAQRQAWARPSFSLRTRSPFSSFSFFLGVCAPLSPRARASDPRPAQVPTPGLAGDQSSAFSITHSLLGPPACVRSREAQRLADIARPTYRPPTGVIGIRLCELRLDVSCSTQRPRHLPEPASSPGHHTCMVQAQQQQQ